MKKVQWEKLLETDESPETMMAYCDWLEENGLELEAKARRIILENGWEPVEISAITTRKHEKEYLFFHEKYPDCAWHDQACFEHERDIVQKAKLPEKLFDHMRCGIYQEETTGGDASAVGYFSRKEANYELLTKLMKLIGEDKW